MISGCLSRKGYRSVRSSFPGYRATIELSVLSIIVALLIGIPVGIISAVKRFSLLDKIGTFLSLLGVSMPGFWFSLLLIILFSVTLEWLPIRRPY